MANTKSVCSSEVSIFLYLIRTGCRFIHSWFLVVRAHPLYLCRPYPGGRRCQDFLRAVVYFNISCVSAHCGEGGTWTLQPGACSSQAQALLLPCSSSSISKMHSQVLSVFWNGLFMLWSWVQATEINSGKHAKISKGIRRLCSSWQDQRKRRQTGATAGGTRSEVGGPGRQQHEHTRPQPSVQAQREVWESVWWSRLSQG